MNKMIAGLFAAALVAAPAFADVGAPAPTAKDLEKAVDQVNYVETAKSGIKLSGYVDAGYTYNFQANSFAKSGSDATSRGDFNLNAVKLTLEKPLSSANELQAGFRADIKVGEDASILAGKGFVADGTYDRLGAPNDSPSGSLDFGSDNLSLDQAYVIIRAPWGNGLDISVGKFASLLGYEVDDRPANLNVTFGYDYFFATTHQTGVKFFYPVNDIVDLQLAISNGSSLDSSVSGSSVVGSDQSDGYGVTGTINIKAPGGNANLFNGIYASTGALDGFTQDGSPIQWNTWGNWAPKFANDKLLLGFSQILADAGDSTLGADDVGYTYWTASLYAKYQFTDIFSLAGRASYFHSIDGDPITVPSAINGDAWSWTATAGFDLLENLMLRAEYRIDLFDGASDEDGIAVDQGETAQTIALQAVYTF